METINETLDTDLAIMIISSPVWMLGFIYLIVAGWLSDKFKGEVSECHNKLRGR